MKTLEVELKNSNALGILEGLENANLIKIRSRKGMANSLSKRVKGSISSERAEELKKELVAMKDEWSRSI